MRRACRLGIAVLFAALSGCARFVTTFPEDLGPVPVGDGNADRFARDGATPDGPGDAPRGDRSLLDGEPRDGKTDGRRADSFKPADLPGPSGLVAAWLFDEGSGQTVSGAPGASGFLGKNSTADPADPLWEKTAARICSGGALTFDGDDAVVTVPGPSTPGLSAFTISFSLYLTGTGGGGLPRILTKEDGGASDTLVHYRAADKAIAVNMFDTANTLYATFAAGVVAGQRANWALTYDDAGDRRLHAFKNGQETTYLRQDAVGGPLRTTTNPWTIGNQSTGVRGFDGTIDDVRVYKRVLSKSEIAGLSSLCPP